MKLRITFQGSTNFPERVGEIPARVIRVSMGLRCDDSVVGAQFEDTNLANAVLSELLRVQMRISLALREVMNAHSSKAELANVIESICDAVTQAMEAENALLFLSDKEQRVLYCKNLKSERKGILQIRRDEGLLGKAANSLQVTNIRDPFEDSLYEPGIDQVLARETHCALCIPLRGDGDSALGLLVILNKRHGSFTSEDEEVGKAVANQISIVLRETFLVEGIRTMENFNERVLESIASGVVTFNKTGQLTSVNRAATKIFGFHPCKNSGGRIVDLLGRTANPRWCSLAEDVLATGRRRRAYDMRFLRKDQTSCSLNLTAAPLEDGKGNLIGGVLVTEDITKEQRFMNTLCRYLSREVAEQVLRDQKIGKLGGTRAEVTVLVADIRNFTTISEEVDPMDLLEMLNAYYPRMINVIFRHHGMVDKFMGDAILAVFGVPVRGKDDPVRAVQAALEIRKELNVINRKRTSNGQRVLEIGIGITSGTVISGNIGSERRMDFTVIGDPVNLASRLEGLTKEAQRKILISESVFEAVEKDIPCEPLGLFVIKGKKEKVRVFSVRTMQ